MAADIGGAGDSVLRLQSEKAEMEPTGQHWGADGTKNEVVPLKLQQALPANRLAVEETVSPCTVADEHNDVETCMDQLVPRKHGEQINVPEYGEPEPKPSSQSGTEDVVCRESPICTPSGRSSAQIDEQGATLMEVTSPVYTESPSETADIAVMKVKEEKAPPVPIESPSDTANITVIKVKEENCETDCEEQNCETATSQVMQDGGDSPKDGAVSRGHDNDSLMSMTYLQKTQNMNGGTAITSQTSMRGIQRMVTEQPVPNPNSVTCMHDLGIFANSITDSTTASFYRAENLKPSISQVSHQPVSSLVPFSEFSQQQPVIDSLPGITSFSQGHNLAHMAGALSNCSSNALSTGNLVDNVVYAAVPLQQTATGMQLAPLHTNANTYNLARAKNPGRRVLLPRIRSSSNNPKENTFKDTLSALMYEKPNVGLVQQIMAVFHATGRKEMQPCEVYDGLECCYPYYQHMTHNRKKSWMSSVRHALTSPCFKSRRPEDSDGKLAPRKGSFWFINDSYDPQEKNPKRVTPIKQSPSSPNYQRRPLEVNTQQVNWQPFSGPNHLDNQQHRSVRHSPYNYFSPTRGSFSPVGPSSYPVMYSPTRVYQSQTPTAALLPNGKMIYLSPAQNDSSCQHNQPVGRNLYQAWGADSNTTPSLWQVVQNVGNENCKGQPSQNRSSYVTLNGGQPQQPQGNARFPANCTAATNINTNNATLTPSLGFTSTTQQQQEQLKLQLLQQQIEQQQLQEQQQEIQQQGPADSDPFAVALELSEIKDKQSSGEKGQAGMKPHQETANINSAQEAMTIEMTCTPEPQVMLVAESQNSQQITGEAEPVSAQSQQGCDDLHNMVYQSLGVCNNLDARPTVSEVSTPAQLAATPVTQFSTMPTTNYQLIHYSGTDQQFGSVVM